MFSAIVLAGERPGGNALCQQLGLTSSVLVEVAGKTALQRVFDALNKAPGIQGGLLCGPAEEVYRSTADFEDILQNTAFQWLPPETGLSASAIRGVNKLDQYPVLLTTGDHALLTADLVENFCRNAEAVGGDFVMGLVPYSIVQAAYPQSKRTVQKYRDGSYCGANMFAIMTPAGLAALRFWQTLETQRKQPWKIAQDLGLGNLLRYVFRRATLDQALQRLSDRCGCVIAYALVNEARAAVDVDSLADRDLAEKILSLEFEA